MDPKSPKVGNDPKYDPPSVPPAVPPKAAEVKADKPKSHQITYAPGPGDPVATTWRGVRFIAGKPVETTDEGMYEAARTNPAFNCDGQDVAKEREAKAKADTEREEQELEVQLSNDEAACTARQAADVEALKVRHALELDALKARRASLEDDKKRLRAKRELEAAQRAEREALDAAAADAAKRKADLDAKHAAEVAALETAGKPVVVAPVAA